MKQNQNQNVIEINSIRKVEHENCDDLKKIKHQKYHSETLDQLFPNIINVRTLY